MIRFLQQFVRSARADVGSKGRIGPRQIYILPTRHGFVFGAALFLMMLGSLNYDSNLGLMFTFLFTGLGIVAILQTWRNLLDIEVSIHSSAPCFADGDASFPIRLTEVAGRERPAIHVKVENSDSRLIHLPALGDGVSRLQSTMPLRGEHRIGRIQVHTLFPYGFLRAWAYVDSNAQVLVYPKPGAPGLLRSSVHYVKSESGDRGMGADDFVGLRPYRSGDPPRHLDWKALARERGLVTRQFGGDRAERLWLDWNLLQGLDTEERLSRLCRMVIDAAQQDLQFGLRLPDLVLNPDMGETHKHNCLAALARFGGAGR